MAIRHAVSAAACITSVIALLMCTRHSSTAPVASLLRHDVGFAAYTDTTVAAKTCLDARETTLPFVSVIVVTTSVASWVERRQRIRTQFPRNVRLIQDPRQTALLMFAIGVHGVEKSVLDLVRHEAATFSDILFLDCMDQDDQLNEPANWKLDAGPSATTSKVMYAAEWAVQHYAFQYLFRLGDDSYLRIDKFLSLLALQAIPARNTIAGRFYTHNVFGIPQRFAQGSGYALTFDVCVFIAKNTDFLLRTAPEDCVVSRWMYALGATFYDSPLWRELANDEHCDADMVLAHRLPADLWANIHDDGTVDC